MDFEKHIERMEQARIIAELVNFDGDKSSYIYDQRTLDRINDYGANNSLAGYSMLTRHRQNQRTLDRINDDTLKLKTEINRI